MNSRNQAFPLVTAAVLCYNHARFVITALESIKAQEYQHIHLVVIDDCSVDDSVDVIQQWLKLNSPNAVFIAHKTNVGVCRSFNEAIANAKGKYVRHLAADDCWIPNSLSQQIEIMETSPDDVGVLYSDALQINERGELLPTKFIETHRSFGRMPEGWIFETLLDGNFIPGLTALIRLRCFEIVGSADESLLTEDWDLWLRISRHFKFKWLPIPSAYYRVLEGSMTRTLDDDIVESEQRMFVKYLRNGWLSGKAKEEGICAEYLVACRAYRQGQSDRLKEAASVFCHRKKLRHALLLLFVATGIPYRQFNYLITILTNFKDRIIS